MAVFSKRGKDEGVRSTKIDAAIIDRGIQASEVEPTQSAAGMTMDVDEKTVLSAMDRGPDARKLTLGRLEECFRRRKTSTTELVIMKEPVARPPQVEIENEPVAQPPRVEIEYDMNIREAESSAEVLSDWSDWRDTAVVSQDR